VRDVDNVENIQALGSIARNLDTKTKCNSERSRRRKKVRKKEAPKIVNCEMSNSVRAKLMYFK